MAYIGLTTTINYLLMCLLVIRFMLVSPPHASLRGWRCRRAEGAATFAPRARSGLFPGLGVQRQELAKKDRSPQPLSAKGGRARELEQISPTSQRARIQSDTIV